jgi:GntR family transcriptional regulator/MocR family aminotransferase
MRQAFPVDLVLDAERAPGRGVREHLVEQLRAVILAGQARASEPLPSTRSLAAAVGVSRGTVVAAYEELAGEGYVTIAPGSGTFVAADLPAASSSPTPRAARGAAETFTRAQEPPRRTINLSPGSPAATLHRSREWKVAWREAARRELPGLPPPPAGEAEFRAAVADHLRAGRGVQCEADDIVVTAGASDGLGLLVHALRGGGSNDIRIATESPGHRASRAVISRLGAVPVPMPVRDGGMDVDRLAHAAGPFAAALLTPSHQYPLGGRLPVSSRLALLRWAKSTGAVVIEDDYDSEFRHGAPSLPAIASLDDEGCVVLVGTLSKTLSPWLRCGYLLVRDDALRARVLETRDVLGHPVSGMVQIALSEFLRTGGLRRHLVRVEREYAHRRRLVIEATADLAPRIRLDAIEGGLHATLSWEDGGSDEAVVEALAREGVEVAPLSAYYCGPTEPERRGVVFGYGAPTDLELRTALDAIRDALVPQRD